MKIRKALQLLAALACLGQGEWALAQTPADLSLQTTNGGVLVGISGTASNVCTLQYATNLTAVNPWHYLTYLPLTNTPALVSDTNRAPAGACFYRAFTALLPTNVVPITNMVWISPGTFIMGSPTNEALRGSDETEHVVTLSHGFFMGKFLVTQGEYAALTSTNPSFFKFLPDSTNDPVDSVTWSDATNYCALLTRQERSAGRLPANWAYRLPTESEWEYACRAGTTTAVYYGNQLLSGMANFNGTNEYDSTTGTITNVSGIYLQKTTAVGSYEANAWGLFDMCGNVFEWCSDWYGPYPPGPVTDPQGPVSGTYHVLRGGAWDYAGQYCRSALRAYFVGSSTSYDIGFRVVLAPVL